MKIISTFQVYQEITSHWLEWPSSKNLQTINAGKGMEKREPSCTVGGKVNWYSHYGRRYGESLKKSRNKTTTWPSNPTAGHILWENHNSKRHMYPGVHRSTISTARTWKQPRCPSTHEWIKNLWYMNAMEYYSAIKRNTLESVLMRWMNLKPIIEWSKSEREKTSIVY